LKLLRKKDKKKIKFILKKKVNKRNKKSFS
jgi:hypothetical protein